MDERHRQVDDIVSALHGAAKRVTSAKRTVAEVLMNAADHLTADEITHEVQKRLPVVSPSTVYRILDEFEELAIVVHAHLGQHAAVYHLAGLVHGHLTCEHCGETFQISAAHFDALSRDLKKTYGFLLDRHHMAITGTCAACQLRRHSTA